MIETLHGFMEPHAVAWIVGIFVALFVIGVPLFVTIGITTALCLWLISGIDTVTIPQNMFSTTDNVVLMAIPFFILAGVLMTAGDISRRLVAFSRSLVSWIPGGLAISAVGSCMIFAAISGSSPATVVAIGIIMYPALVAERFPDRFSLGLVTSAGSLGILIPPSIPMIIYAIVVGTSVADLFLGGVGPGLLIGSILILYSLFTGWRHRIPTAPFRVSEVVTTFRHGFWGIMLPVLILGGIYSGAFTVTEAAGVSVVYAFVVETFIHRKTTVRQIPRLFSQAAVEMGAILIIISVAVSLSWFLTVQRVPYELAEWIQSVTDSRVGFLLILNGILLVTGCLMDIVSAILILAPLIAPIAKEYGVDPIHLGI
ncbi:MAG: TRAP transporter large permease subunit, partial [Myxococcales bacterium]|nr:TRAP transporter large permease subunit [Myxococcales bacterium]